MTTDNRDKFVELANRRVPAAIKAIRAVARLADRRSDYDEGDAEAIANALEVELERLKDRFNGGEKSDAEFRLE